MSFTINVQRFEGDKYALDKTEENILTLTGELREGTSIIDPVFKIQGDLTDVALANYLTVPIFERKYFITNIKALLNDLYEISAHVDVLATYKAQIRSQRGIIRRQENNWNLYLNDGTFRVYQDPRIITTPFPSGFSTQEFVLAVAGG